jgi:hypothetical protein
MTILWEQGDSELSGRQVADVLPGHAYTTVATVLDRLVHKGLVRRRMDGRAIRFAAIGSQGAHTGGGGGAPLLPGGTRGHGGRHQPLTSGAGATARPRPQVSRTSMKAIPTHIVA